MKHFARAVWGFLLVIILAACNGSPNFMDSASPQTEEQTELYIITMIMSAAVFAVVVGLLAYIIYRFRFRPDRKPVPEQTYRVKLIEFTYTFIPLVLVTILFVLTVRTLSALDEPAKDDDALTVRVYGYRWWWEYEYPDLDIVTANELHVPVDTNVHLELLSIDVIHTFWVPQLFGKIDNIPGQTNNSWFRATKTGEFDGFCAEYCGSNHANMRIKIFVDSQEDFEAWVRQQQQPPPQPQTDQEEQGYNLVASPACRRCHPFGADVTVPDLIGPDLAHLYTRTTFAGSIFRLDEDNLRRWLEDPQAMKPGNLMPNLNLNSETIDALVAYLLKE